MISLGSSVTEASVTNLPPLFRIVPFTSPENEITAMCVGENGEILFSGLVNGTMRNSGGKFVTLASVTELPKLIISLAEAADGKVWLGTKDAGLYYLDHGRVAAVSTGLPDTKINSLLAKRGEVWIGTDRGVVHWKGMGSSPAEASHVLDDAQGLVMIRDRDSNLWIGTPNGLMRIDARGNSSFDRRDNSSTGPLTSLFEDREGNLWMGR